MRSSRSRLGALVLFAVGLGAFAWSDGQDIAGGETADAMEVPFGERRRASVALNSAQTGKQIAIGIAGPGAGRGPAAVSQSPNPLSRLAKVRLQQTLARPLFSPSRRPPPVLVKPRKQPKAPLPVKKPARMDLALVGILSVDKNAIAVLRHKKAGRSYSVRVGDMVAGWRVRKITASSVVLVGKSTSHILPLFENKTL